MRKLYQIILNIRTQPFLGLILLGCFFGTNAHAQPFPVSVNTQLSSPSLPYLADYVREKPESLRVLLLLNDDRRTNYEVLLKIRISGQGIELASRPDYFSAPVNLLFNVPELLTGFELADLFDPNNLDISGMAKSEFLKTGQLPEGIYTICFEAYDINRFEELPVSNGGCAVASVIEHEPPYLIQPTGITPFTEPTILPFNWHPGHTNSFRTEYRLYLYEEIPGWTHDQIILSQAPLYTVETNATTYLYSAIDPFLEKGATYLWRVQAYDPDGFELFKNNGFSQLAQFTYGQNCDAPLGLQALTVHSNTQLIRWVDNNPGTYELRYRPEVVPLNSNPDTVNPTTTTVSGPPPSGIGLVNPKGKDKNGNSPIVTTAPTTTGTPANAGPFVNPDNIAWNFWATISDIKQPEYLLNNLISSRYQIQVRRICGPGNTSPWSAALTIDNRQPESPEFLLPPKATEPTEITETLFTANWEYQTEAYFELQIARDTGFAILVPGYENLTVTDLQQPITGLASGQTYFYRVKALRGDLESAYSNVQLVQTVSTDPYNLPSLLALPAQPTTYDGFTAHWTGTTPFLLYHLEIARDREFTQPLPGYEDGSQPITSGINQLSVSVDLLPQGVFYRIRSAGIGGVGYSNIIEVPRQYLPVPVALEPTEITDQGFTAHWEALPEATEYIIDVATNAEFNELIPELSNQTVSGTSIVFSEYLDPENTTYFYQVRAKINDRTSGNSNPIVVNEGGLAVVPVALPATQIKKTSFWANWENLAGINTYTLDVATQPDFEPGSFVDGFENKTVYGNTCKITSVDFSGTNYYYRIRAVENDQYSIYSNAQNVEWKGCYFGPMAMDYSCGIPADPYFNEQFPLLTQLEKGDTIQAGDFLVILNEVTGSSPFSGSGYVAMPFQQLRLNLDFSNIKVDETCRMVDGRMEVTGAGLALISQEIADQINDILEVLDEIDQTLESVENVLEEISDVLTATESVGGYFTNGIHLIEGTDPIFSEYPYLPPGATDSLQGAIDCFVTTLSPDCKDDLVNGLQILQDNLADHFNSSQQIIFQASSDQIYGFDSIVHPAFSEHYQGITVAGKPYQISWKSVENGQTDVVEARTGNGLPFPANIRFEDTDKNEIPTEIEGNIARLTITGAGDQSVYPIYAVEVGDTVKLAGKLNMVSYNPKPVQLVVVPVNGVAYPFSSDNLATQLQTIFQPALVDLSVRIAPNFTVADFDNELDAISTGFAQSYTQEMKDLFRAYEDANALDEDAYYIFLLPRFADTDQLGYMPRKRSFGFVNHEQLQSQENQYVKTLAHELAHGAFVLHHTFEQHPQLEGNSTENLLDYSPAGTITHQYQWVAMHDPSRAWTLFDEDEERGQVNEADVVFTSITYDGYPVIKYTGDQESFSNITPSGQEFKLPKRALATYYPRDGIWPGGSLAGFEIDGETYWGWWSETTTPKTFKGYAKRKFNEFNQLVSDESYIESYGGISDSVYVAVVLETCDVKWKGIPRGDYAFTQENFNQILSSIDHSTFYISQEFILPSSDCYTDIELCLNKYEGHPMLIGNDPLARYLQENPCEIANLENYRFDAGIPESDWIRNLKNIVAGMTATGFTPILATVLGEMGVVELIKVKAVDFGVGYTIDMLLQRSIHYYFPGEGQTETVTWESTRDKVDHVGAFISGAEAMITLKSKWRELGVQSAVSCLSTGFLDKGVIKESFDGKQCAIGVGSVMLFHGIVGGSKAGIKHLRELPPEKLLKGLDNLFGKGPATPGDGFPPPVSATFIPEINGKIYYRIFKAISSNPLDSKSIKRLLGTSDEKADEVFNTLSGPNGPMLQKELFDDGLFENIRRADLSDINRGKLVQDLVDNPIFAKEMGEILEDGARDRMVRAWKVLDDAGAVAMKTDVSWLTKVDNWTQAGYPANKINKAVSEIANNATLKAGFEADEVVFDAWKWVDDGIPTLPQGQPGTYVNYLKRKTIYLNQASQGGGPVKYYRVQQAGPNGPEEILFLDGNGNVTFGSSSNDWLNFSTDNIDHARHFKDIDPANRYIIEFEMPKSFDDAMKGDAIPQWGATNNANYADGVTPQIADPNQPGHPFTTRQWDAYWKSEFQLNVITGSGKIVP